MSRVRPDRDFELVDDSPPRMPENLHKARMLKRSHNMLRRVNEILSDTEIREFEEKVRTAHNQIIGLCVQSWLEYGGGAIELASIARTAKL